MLNDLIYSNHNEELSFNCTKIYRKGGSGLEIKEMLEGKDRDLFSYFKLFLEKPCCKEITNETYHIGIYTIGLSIYPILLSLLATKPQEKLILMFTNESKKYEDVLRAFVNIISPGCDIEVVTYEVELDTAELFNKFEEHLFNIDKKKVAIDITGGKKPSIAAGFLAASIAESSNTVDILYMDSKFFGKYEKVLGTEEIIRLINPNNFFQSSNMAIIKELFSTHQYLAAQRLIKAQLKKLLDIREGFPKYNLERQIKDLEVLSYYSELYDLRMNLNYGERMEVNNVILSSGEIEVFNEIKSTYKKISELSNSQEIKKLDNVIKALKLNSMIYKQFKSSVRGYEYLVCDRLASAMLYKKINYQEYIIRLVSVLEAAGILISQGKEVDLKGKIGKNGDYSKKLHELRRLRNNLGLIHGFTYAESPDIEYENDVIKFAAEAFGINSEEIRRRLNKSFKFKDYDQIINN